MEEPDRITTEYENLRSRSSDKTRQEQVGLASAEVKHQISLKYEKIELEHKLAEMV